MLVIIKIILDLLYNTKQPNRHLMWNSKHTPHTNLHNSNLHKLRY